MRWTKGFRIALGQTFPGKQKVFIYRLDDFLQAQFLLRVQYITYVTQINPRISLSNVFTCSIGLNWAPTKMSADPDWEAHCLRNYPNATYYGSTALWLTVPLPFLIWSIRHIYRILLWFYCYQKRKKTSRHAADRCKGILPAQELMIDNFASRSRDFRLGLNSDGYLYVV